MVILKESSKQIVFSTVLSELENVSIFEVNMSLIKKKAKLSAGTVYYHFPNGIEDVYSDLFINIVTDLRQELLNVSKKNNLSLKETLNILIDSYFGWHKTQKRESNFLWCVSGSGIKKLRLLLIEEFSVFSSGIYKILEKKANAEGIKLAPPAILDAILFGATRELVHSWITRGRDEQEFQELSKDLKSFLYRSCVEGVDEIS